MGWLLAALARVAFLVIWVTMPLVNRAFHGNWVLPLLGLLFLPFTALAYVLVYTFASGVTGWAWFWVALGFLIDLSTHSAGAYSSRRRIQRYSRT